MTPNREAREEELRHQWKYDVTKFIDTYRIACQVPANKPLPRGLAAEEMIAAILEVEFRNER